MNLVTAIQAIKAKKLIQVSSPTYANILLRPAPKRSAKSSAIKLSKDEANAVFDLLERNWAKWRWVVGSDHTRYIYCQDENGLTKITSISGYYSGAIKNQFNVLKESGKWLMVETLKAGSDWWTKPIPLHLVHSVYSFKGALPKCGPVRLPVITASGYGWIERWQVLA